MSDPGPSSPSAKPAPRPRRTLIVLVAAGLSLAAIIVALIAAGETEPSARVFDVAAGDRRYWAPGVLRPGDQMRCHGEVYDLWHAGPDDSVAFGDTGITVGHARDGSIIATCPNTLPAP
jgi:hypothetical protein